ncbi:MAG: Rha family transcriptional regulator [Oscillospiraceae bacterium]|nr:Rha family transcriptional regulator [Oscillospiraceae bacterium]
MTDLTIIKQNGGSYIDSREIAELIGKQHGHLLRDMRGYIEIMTKNGLSKDGLSDFFVGNSYINAQNKEMPCYFISKMGCELIANKLIGEKGILFTVAYVRKFNDMEQRERAELEARAAISTPRLGEYNSCARIVIRALRELGAMPEDIILFLRELYKPLGIAIAADTVIDKDKETEPQIPRMYTAKQIAEKLSVYSLNGNPHPQAVSCILNENLFIGDAHKIAVTLDCGDHIGISVRYDEYAVQSAMDWIVEYGFPGEIYGFERTYKVRYEK